MSHIWLIRPAGKQAPPGLERSPGLFPPYPVAILFPGVYDETQETVSAHYDHHIPQIDGDNALQLVVAAVGPDFLCHQFGVPYGSV